jgi:hypothetical protein
MSGINSGVLTNAHPISSDVVKEIEDQVLNSKLAFVYLDENYKLCFALPLDVEDIKDLAWHNAYELTANKNSGILFKKLYKKAGLDSYDFESMWQKAHIEDEWTCVEPVTFKLSDGAEFLTSDGLIFNVIKEL